MLFYSTGKDSIIGGYCKIAGWGYYSNFRERMEMRTNELREMSVVSCDKTASNGFNCFYIDPNTTNICFNATNYGKRVSRVRCPTIKLYMSIT